MESEPASANFRKSSIKTEEDRGRRNKLPSGMVSLILMKVLVSPGKKTVRFFLVVVVCLFVLFVFLTSDVVFKKLKDARGAS